MRRIGALAGAGLTIGHEQGRAVRAFSTWPKPLTQIVIRTMWRAPAIPLR